MKGAEHLETLKHSEASELVKSPKTMMMLLLSDDVVARKVQHPKLLIQWL